MSDNVDRTNLERSATVAHVIYWPCCIVVLFINSRCCHYVLNVHVMIIFIYWFWFLRLCSYFMIYCLWFYFPCLVLAVLGIEILGEFAQLRKATISFDMSVCRSVRMQKLGSHQTDEITKVVISVFSKQLSRKFEFRLNSHKNTVIPRLTSGPAKEFFG